MRIYNSYTSNAAVALKPANYFFLLLKPILWFDRKLLLYHVFTRHVLELQCCWDYNIDIIQMYCSQERLIVDDRHGWARRVIVDKHKYTWG